MTMHNRCMITKMDYAGCTWDFLFYVDSMDRPIEIHPFRKDQPSLVGNIYTARVDQVLPQMKAAFLSSGQLKFFYSLEEDFAGITFTKKQGKKDELVQGDELLVQVTRDAIKSKAICASSNLSLSSDHVIMTSANRIHGISQKIKGMERQRITDEVLLQLENISYGFVIRTNAKDIDAKSLIEEITSLEEKMQQFLENSKHKVCGQLLYKEAHPFFAHLRRYLTEGLDEIVSDDLEIFSELSCDDRYKEYLRLYEDGQYPLEKLYGLRQKIDQALGKNVYLPSGGSLVIEATEAMTVIDVNSSNNVKNKKDKDYYLSNNLEAAEEIARQIRLRNLNGIIIVDFINLSKKKEQEELLSYMRNLVKKDYAKVTVVDFTRLGLMEITRAKKYPSLSQILIDDGKHLC